MCTQPPASHCSSIWVWGVVTHLPDCHITMGLPFEWQDNYSEITPLPSSTNIRPPLPVSGHTCSNILYFLPQGESKQVQQQVLAHRTYHGKHNANFTYSVTNSIILKVCFLQWYALALWRGFWWLSCCLLCRAVLAYTLTPHSSTRRSNVLDWPLIFLCPCAASENLENQSQTRQTASTCNTVLPSNMLGHVAFVTSGGSTLQIIEEPSRRIPFMTQIQAVILGIIGGDPIECLQVQPVTCWHPSVFLCWFLVYSIDSSQMIDNSPSGSLEISNSTGSFVINCRSALPHHCREG